jgi:magnesium-transporting ATPase (P-type)
MAALTLIVLVIRFCIENYVSGSFHTSHLKRYVEMLLIAFTVLIVAIPEGLPLAVTLALAYSVRQVR